MQEIQELIKRHDKFFEYSDDMNAYSRGKAEKDAILKAIMAANNCDKKEAIRIYVELT